MHSRTDIHLRDARDHTAPVGVGVLLDHDMSGVDGIVAAAAALERSIPGYVRPAFHGSGTLGPSGTLSLEVFNDAGHDFPALLLAAICGHTGGTEAVVLSVQQVELAISAMAPAEKCRAFQHPNIAAWRRIAARVHANPTDAALAIFVAEPNWCGASPLIRSFFEARWPL